MKVSDVIGDDAEVVARGEKARRPRVSIITPTFNRNAEGLLTACLQSARDQTFTDFEHIIVDDGSVDGTEGVVRRLADEDERIVYVRHHRNSGLPAVRTNEGILRARGEAIAFLFDDNVYEPDFLEAAWSALQEERADVVHGKVRMPMPDGTVVVLGGWPTSLDVLHSRNTIANGGVLIRRDFFDRFGLYEPHVALRRLCDWELWIRSLSLGARFRLLPRLVAEERGVVSPNSLGNTVSIDWNLSNAYVHDTGDYADRARRLAPARIRDSDVLDPTRFRRYVRNAAEWDRFAGLIYAPFLDRHKNDFDPALYTNRVESVDPEVGWNPKWAFHPRRFRVLLLANAVTGLGSLILEAARSIPGAIAFNMPEWAMPILEAGLFDVILVLDGANAHVIHYLEQHRAAGARIVYVSAYAEEALGPIPGHPVPIGANPHVVNFAEEPPTYFPGLGYGRPPSAQDAVQSQKAVADITLNLGPGAQPREVGLPGLPVPALRANDGQRGSRISYRLDRDEVGVESGAETFTRGGEGRSAETLAFLVLSRPGSEIRVERRDVDALPVGERIALGCLAATRDVDIVAVGDEPFEGASQRDRTLASEDWRGWFANIIRIARLRQRLGKEPGSTLTIDVYLNSELYAGSEVYGLLTAKNLAALGLRARVRVPERNIYGGDTIAINKWLAEHELEPAIRAPYLPSMHHYYRPEGERAEAEAKLQSFLREDPPDLILASGHMPQLTELHDRPPVFMAFFSAAAYEQAWLTELHGHLHGITSDSAWALGPTQTVVGAPGRVIPSAVLGSGGGQIERVAGKDRSAPVRIVIAGTLQVRKRQLEAVRAVGLLRRRGYDVELHLYGFILDWLKDYVTLVEQAIDSEGLRAHAMIHGFVEDEGEITRDNEVVLCASTDESLPQGLVFQMYQGLIGVSVLCGGVDEIVLDGRTGYLTRDPNPAGIADALARALDDRERWREVAEAAQRHIHERCGATRVTASLLDLFHEGLAYGAPARLRAEQAARLCEELKAARLREREVSSQVEEARRREAEALSQPLLAHASRALWRQVRKAQRALGGTRDGRR